MKPFQLLTLVFPHNLKTNKAYNINFLYGKHPVYNVHQNSNTIYKLNTRHVVT